MNKKKKNYKRKLTSKKSEINLKYIIVGDFATGKTSLLRKFLYNSFEKYHAITVGVDFRSYIIHVGDNIVTIKFWDIAGHLSFRSMISSYYSQSDIVLIVYDITNHISFSNIASWLVEARYYSEDTTQILLLGNKCDETFKRCVPTNEGIKLSRRNDIRFFEVSAKKDNIKEILMIPIYDAINKKLFNDGMTEKTVKKKNMNIMSCCFNLS